MILLTIDTASLRTHLSYINSEKFCISFLPASAVHHCSLFSMSLTLLSPVRGVILFCPSVTNLFHLADVPIYRLCYVYFEISRFLKPNNIPFHAHTIFLKSFYLCILRRSKETFNIGLFNRFIDMKTL